MDWVECKNKKIIKKVSLDRGLINSLIKTSKDKIKSQELLPITNVTASSKVSLAYDGLRELLEAIALEKGFKIYNHECFTAFLKEIIGNSDLGSRFDEIRKLRNQINYYGKKIDEERCKSAIQEIKYLFNEFKKLLK